MTELMEVKVECYSGYKADEYPICFYHDDQRFEILEIIDRWYQRENNPQWPVSNYFKADTECGKRCILKHDLETDKWYLCQIGVKTVGL
jgi:hypothetical protein